MQASEKLRWGKDVFWDDSQNTKDGLFELPSFASSFCIGPRSPASMDALWVTAVLSAQLFLYAHLTCLQGVRSLSAIILQITQWRLEIFCPLKLTNDNNKLTVIDPKAEQWLRVTSFLPTHVVSGHKCEHCWCTWCLELSQRQSWWRSKSFWFGRKSEL